MSDDIIQDAGGDPAPRVATVEVEAPDDGFLARLGDAARENPASAALIAMGAVWLFAGGGRVGLFGQRRDEGGGRQTIVLTRGLDGHVAGGLGRAILPHGGGHATEGGIEAASGAADRAADAAGEASRAAGDAASRAGGALADTASDFGEGAAEAASDLGRGIAQAARAGYEGIETATRRTADAVARGSTGAWDGTEAAGRQAWAYLDDHPVVLAAVGLAAGAGLAMVLPRSEAEKAWLGPRAEAMRSQARRAAARRLEDARRSADQAARRLIRDAESRDLSEDAFGAAIAEFRAKLEAAGAAAKEAAEAEIERAGSQARD